MGEATDGPAHRSLSRPEKGPAPAPPMGPSLSAGNGRGGVAGVISSLFFYVDNVIEIQFCTGRKRR
jgi:hypothetical protein